ncbi:MAG: hypothetical protein JWM57_2984 [Phycisphaerales bacterium]|nr:hypothetical protein [Phycisphaerales bacterium]
MMPGRIKWSRAAVAVLIMVSVAPAAQPGPTSSGVNLERDQLFGFLQSNPAKLSGWLDDMHAGNVRTGIPQLTDTANQAWWSTCWANAASFATQHNVNFTFSFGSAWWGSDASRTATLDSLRSKVHQYAGKIRYYELGNEMDLAFRDKGITVAQYKQWLTDVSGVIRQEDPAARLILTSFAGATANGKPYGYLQNVLAAGCGDLVDYYSLHTYPHISNSAPSADTLRVVTTNVSQMVAAAGASRKELLITEAGYALDGQFAPADASEAAQRRWNVQLPLRLHAKDIADIYPIGRVDTFVLKDYSVGDGSGHFGMLTTTEAKRLQYDGMATEGRLLDGAKFLRETPLTNGKCYEYLGAGGKKVAVAWSSTAKTLTLPTGSSASRVLDVAGNVQQSSTSSAASVTTGLDPQYVVTDSATYWQEGELPTHLTGATGTSTNEELYGGNVLAIDSNTAGDRSIDYAFNLKQPGIYSVFIAASTPDGVKASPYRFGFGSDSDSLSSLSFVLQTNAVVTGTSYGANDEIAWTALGDFTISTAGISTLTLLINQPRTADGRYVFELDAVYIELKSTSVPEPSSLLTVAACGMASTLRRHRQQGSDA